MRLIRDGVVDREGVEGLAGRLGYSTRQLNRLITAEVGTGPLALARAQRSQTARVLLETTDLPVAHVAFAAGFASVRQCNDTVRQTFADTPSGLRRTGGAHARWAGATSGSPPPRPSGSGSPAGSPSTPRRCSTSSGCARCPASRRSTARPTRAACGSPTGTAIVTLRAPEPTDAEATATARPTWKASSSSRTCATCRPRWRAAASCSTSMPTPSPSGRPSAGDPLVGALVRRDPGRRVPGAADGFELAVRAVIGQQVSVPGARTVAGRLVLAAGELLPAPLGAVTHLFPTPAALVELAERRPGAFSMPAGTAPRPGGAGPGGRRRRRGDRPWRRPGRAAPLPRGASRHRPVDGGVRRHARAARPRRLHADGPRHPAGAPWRSACPTTRPICAT